MRAADAMTPLHNNVHPDHPLKEAMARMREDDAAVLPVIDGDEMVGLLSMADASGDSTAWEVDPDKAAVRDVMRAKFAWCYADEAVGEDASAVTVVVNRDHEVVGMIGHRGGAAAARPDGPHTAETAGRATGDPSGDDGGGPGYRVRPRIRPETISS